MKEFRLCEIYVNFTPIFTFCPPKKTGVGQQRPLKTVQQTFYLMSKNFEAMLKIKYKKIYNKEKIFTNVATIIFTSSGGCEIREKECGN